MMAQARASAWHVPARSVAALWVVLGLGCAAGNATAPEAASVPVPRQAAVGKMIRAVERAARPDARAEAMALLEQAVAEDPELWEARYNLAILLAQNGALERAQLELARAHELAPNAEDVVAALGEVLRRSDELAGAVAVLTDFVAAYPGASQARGVLVVVLRESGQAEAALVQARALRKHRPGDAAALAELALTHLALGQVDIAQLLIQEALKGEGRAVVQRAAGLIALQQGEDALAFAHFARATELDPNDTAAGLNTATVLLQAGVYDRAEKHFRAVLDVEPDAEAAKLGLAAALRGRGRRDQPAPYQAAEALLKEILASAPNHWAAAHNLAVLYAESMDRPSDATAHFDLFLRNAPLQHPARVRAKKWMTEHASAKPSGTALAK